VNAVMNLRISYKEGNILNSWTPISFSRRTLLHGVKYRVNYIRHYAHFRKGNISLVMTVRPSVRTHRITRKQLDGFLKKLIIEIFLKNVEKLHVFLNSDTDNGYLHKDKHICKTSLRRILLKKWTLPKEFIEKLRKVFYV
jgi:hypothetical protein